MTFYTLDVDRYSVAAWAEHRLAVQATSAEQAALAVAGMGAGPASDGAVFRVLVAREDDYADGLVYRVRARVDVLLTTDGRPVEWWKDHG